MNRRSRSLRPWSLAFVICIATAPILPLGAADLGDISREIRSARRATSDGKYIFDQVQSITKAATVKRKDTLPIDDDNVILYSAARCDECDEARAYLDSKRIAYKEHDVQRSREGRSDYKSLGSPGVPIVLVGSQRLNGWSESRFKRMYAGFKGADAAPEGDEVFEVGSVLTAKIDNVPMFEANNRDSNVVARLKKGEELVAMSADSGELIEVQTSTSSGWVDARLVEAQDE